MQPNNVRGADKHWTLTGMWNRALNKNRDREYEPRTHIWASELGGSYYDRYWRMKGRKPTTPPNLRSRRKFEGGNLAEWIILQVLARARILNSSQKRIEFDGIEGGLRVTGKADFTAGGKIREVPLKRLQDLPESFALVAEVVIAQLREKYPDGLKYMNIEVKSVSGQVFDKYREAPGLHHALQAFHYAYNSKRPTLLVYVSRDDFRITEWIIKAGSKKWREIYLADTVRMAEVLAMEPSVIRKTLKEPLLTWDPDKEKFTKNWKVEYSNYLTDYGFGYPEKYAKPAQSAGLRLSNIVKKIKEGKPIDGKVNQKTLVECYEFYPGAQPIIERMQIKYADVVPVEKEKK
jgi:hypothetical protein